LKYNIVLRQKAYFYQKFCFKSSSLKSQFEAMLLKTGSLHNAVVKTKTITQNVAFKFATEMQH